MDSKDREKDTEEMWASQDNLVPMEADMGLSFDFCLPTPHFFEPHELADVDSMYVPNEDSLSGLYSCYGDSSSPDGANSCSATTTMMVATAATAKAASKNVISERDRRKRLNEKLYALRGVVPNITKMDKASIIRDAIAYIEQLQEQERQMLAEITALESAAAAAAKTENIVPIGGAEGDGVAFPQRKKMRRAPSISSIDDDALCSAASPPVEILEVQVSEVGEKVAVVNVRCGKARDAMAKVCRALESLRLKVVTASVATVAGSMVHTMLIETEGMSGAQVKERVHAALAQLHVTSSSLRSMGY